MKKNITKISARLIIGLLPLWSVSCSKELPKIEHRYGSETSLDESATQINFPTAEYSEINKIAQNSKNLSAEINSAEKSISLFDLSIKESSEIIPEDIIAKKTKVAKNLYLNHLQKIEGIVLNPNYSGNSDFSNNKEYRRLLREYNDGLAVLLSSNSLDLIANESNQPNLQETILLKYWSMATIGCNAEAQSCNRSIDLLSSTSKSALVLQQIALMFDRKLLRLKSEFEQNKISNEKFKNTKIEYITNKFLAMRLSMAVRNSSPAVEDRIALLYLISNHEFEELPEKIKNSEISKQHRGIINKITESLPSRMKNEDVRVSLSGFMRDVKMWERFSISNIKNQKQQFGSIVSATEIMKLSCKFFYKSTDIEQSIEKTLKKVDANNNLGFLAELDKIKSGKNSLILANMRVDYKFEANELLYIIDQIYRGHWSNDIAQECWNASLQGKSIDERKKIESKFIRIFENYVRVEIIKKIISTNDFMSNVFVPRNKNELKPSSEQVFYRAIDESKLLKDAWESMIAKIGYVNNFIRGNQNEVSSDRQSPEYKKLQLMISAIRPNIKLFAAYPNMLLLCYYLAVKEFSVTISSWVGSYSLNAEMIISWILGDTVKDTKVARPLFDFGNDSNPIQTFENLYSFFYALKSNTFNTFSQADVNTSADSTDKIKAISDINFFAEVSKRYLNSEVNELKIKIQKLELQYSDNEQYKLMKQICRVEKNKRELDPRKKIEDIPPYKHKFGFYDITNYTLVSYNNNEIGSSAAQIYNIDTEIALKDIHNNVYRKILLLSTMVDILEDHWKTILSLKDSDPSSNQWNLSVNDYVDATNKIEEIRSNFNQAHDYIRRFEHLTLGKHRDQGSCLYDLYLAEVDQEYSLYEREIGYLALVYKSLEEMRGLILEFPDQKIQIEEEYTLAANGRTKSNWDKDSLLYKVAMASKVYMNTVGDVRGADVMSYSGGYTYSRWNMILRMRNNLQEINPMIEVNELDLKSLDRDDFYKKSNERENIVEVQIDSNVSMDQFIGRVLAGADSKDFLKWWSQSRLLINFSNRIDTMLQLYINETSGSFTMAKKHCNQVSSKLKKDSLSSCGIPKDNIEQVTAAEIAKEILNVAQLIHIDEREEPIMRYLKKQRKFQYFPMFVKVDNDEELPILNNVFDTLLRSKAMLLQAQAAMQTFNAMLATGKNESDPISTTEENNDSNELIFLSKHDSVRKLTRRNYQPIAHGTIKRIKDFERVAICLEEEHSKSHYDIRYLYELDLNRSAMRSGKWLDPKKMGNGRALYIEQRSRENFVNLVNDFRRYTKRTYDLKPGDEGYGVKEREVPCEEILKDFH